MKEKTKEQIVIEKEKKRNYYLKNKLKIIERIKKYNKINSIKRKNYMNDYVNKNKDVLKIKNKEYSIKNNLKISCYQKKWRENNKDAHRNYIKFNKERVNHLTRISRMKRRQLDKGYKFRNNLTSSLSMLLSNKIFISPKSEKYIGCSSEEFRKHIELQFDINMNWENYGSYWELDHIMPCAVFNLNNEEERLLCFNYKNLRPLIRSENRLAVNYYKYKNGGNIKNGTIEILRPTSEESIQKHNI